MEALAGIGGAVFGAVAGGVISYLFAVHREDRRDRIRLLGAIEVVLMELQEDERRLGGKERLTLGDWAENKGTLAQLAVRDPPLWKELAHSYGLIYEAQRREEDGSAGAEEARPKPGDLGNLVEHLEDHKTKLFNQIHRAKRM